MIRCSRSRTVEAVTVPAWSAICAGAAFPRMPGFVRTARTEEATEMQQARKSFEEWLRGSIMDLDGACTEEEVQAVLDRCRGRSSLRELCVYIARAKAKIKNVVLKDDGGAWL